MHQEHRHLRAVLAGEEDLLGLVLVGIEPGNLRRAEQRALSSRDLVAEDRGRIRERREGVEQRGVVHVAAEAADAAEAGQLDLRSRARPRGCARRPSTPRPSCRSRSPCRRPPRSMSMVSGFSARITFQFAGSGLVGIDADHAPVGSVIVGEDQQLAAHAFEHVVSVVADLRNQRRELRARASIGPARTRRCPACRCRDPKRRARRSARPRSVLSVWKRCGFFSSRKTSSSADCGVPMRW